MSVKKAKKTTQSEEDISNKLALIFITAVAALGLLMVINRLILNGETFLLARNIIIAALPISAASIIGFGVAFFLCSGRAKKVCSFLLKISVGLLLSCLFILFDFIFAIKALYIIISALCVTSLIYYIYPFEFFVHTILCVGSAISFWILSHMMTISSPNAIFIVSGSLSLVFICLILTLLAMKNGGSLNFFSHKIHLFGKNSNYIFLFITFAVIFSAFASAILFFSSAFAYYLIFALLGYLVVIAIYYTARLV